MPKNTEEPDYAAALGKPPTILQKRFSDWLMEAVGYDPTSAKTKKAAFEEGVRLGVQLRMPFQASAYNRAENARLKAENAAKRAAAGDPDKPVRPKKVAKAPKKAVEVEAEETEVEAEETPAPAPAKRAPAKRVPAKKVAEEAAPVARRAPARRAPARRAAPIGSATSPATDAPF